MNFPYISDHVQRHEDRHPLNAKTTFGTQTQLFDEMSKYSAWLRFSPPMGYCSPFSNMCAEARMKGEELPDFLKESTYNKIFNRQEESIGYKIN